MKKTGKINLDVDFIGNQEKPLTKEESEQISAYIREWKKSKRAKKDKITA